MKTEKQAKAQIGVVMEPDVNGLFVMGRNLARNMARNGYPVAVYDRPNKRASELVAKYGDEGTLIASESIEGFVAAIERPRAVLIMIRDLDPVLDALTPLLEPGDIVIDTCGTHFNATRQYGEFFAARGVHFLGGGVAGGEKGSLIGPSIMLGGPAEAYERIRPIFETISSHVDDEPCCALVGPDGAGQFVKIVLNGVEYGVLQVVAEAYDLLRTGLGASPAEIAEIFRTWNEGEVGSFLLTSVADVLAQTDAITGGPFVDIVVDQLEQRSGGKTSAQNAFDLGVPLTVIAESIYARQVSAYPRVRAAAQLAFPEQSTWKLGDRDEFLEDVRKALYASMIVVYAQGFEQIGAGNTEYGWNIDRGTVAAIWRNCPVHADLLNPLRSAFEDDSSLTTPLVAPHFAEAVRSCAEGWRRSVAEGISAAVPLPAMSAALAYYDGLRRERSAAAVIQGSRDHFGSHGYRRIDMPGTFHTDWIDTKTESPA